jgi:hypothetical protein
MGEGDEREAGQEKVEAELKARLDEDGLPLDRPVTLDDVRGTAGSGRAVAIGCTVIVALAVLLFWLVRAGFLG